jgi:PHP family Zn ribbon phosphoesterase
VSNEPEILGDQPIVDEEGNILGFEERLLLNSLNLSLEEIIRRVQEQGGVTIPSHYDRSSFSLISQLGFIPPHLPLEAIEMSRRPNARQGEDSSEGFRSIPRIASSDAHQLEDIGNARTILLLAEATLDELRMAFREQQGRRIVKYAHKSLDPA